MNESAQALTLNSRKCLSVLRNFIFFFPQVAAETDRLLCMEPISIKVVVVPRDHFRVTSHETRCVPVRFSLLPAT